MVLCYFPGCSHDSDKATCKPYAFPTVPKIKEKWFEIVAKASEHGKAQNYTRNSKICSCHFENGDRTKLPTILRVDDASVVAGLDLDVVQDFEPPVELRKSKKVVQFKKNKQRPGIEPAEPQNLEEIVIAMHFSEPESTSDADETVQDQGTTVEPDAQEGLAEATVVDLTTEPSHEISVPQPLSQTTELHVETQNDESQDIIEVLKQAEESTFAGTPLQSTRTQLDKSHQNFSVSLIKKPAVSTLNAHLEFNYIEESTEAHLAPVDPEELPPPTFTVASKSYKVNSAKTILSSQLYEFYRDGLFYDTRLNVNGECINAHRLVLCAGSKFFYKYFSNAAVSKKPGELVEFSFGSFLPEGCTVEDLQTVIDFMYTGFITVMDDRRVIIQTLAVKFEVDILETVFEDPAEYIYNKQLAPKYRDGGLKRKLVDGKLESNAKRKVVEVNKRTAVFKRLPKKKTVIPASESQVAADALYLIGGEAEAPAEESRNEVVAVGTALYSNTAEGTASSAANGSTEHHIECTEVFEDAAGVDVALEDGQIVTLESIMGEGLEGLDPDSTYGLEPQADGSIKLVKFVMDSDTCEVTRVDEDSADLSGKASRPEDGEPQNPIPDSDGKVRLKKINYTFKDDGDGLHLCELCDYATDSYMPFRRHYYQVHQTIVQIPCESCKKVFTNQSHFKRHVQDKHRTDREVFPCPICGMIFPRLNRMERHHDTFHSDIAYPCEICGVKLKNKDSLLRHRREIHKNPNTSNVCYTCGKNFHLPRYLEQHVSRMHQFKNRKKRLTVKLEADKYAEIEIDHVAYDSIIDSVLQVDQ